MKIRVLLVYLLLLGSAAHVQAQQVVDKTPVQERPVATLELVTGLGTALGALFTGIAAIIAALQYAANNRRQKLVRLSELRHLIETDKVRDGRRNIMATLTQPEFLQSNPKWWTNETLHGNASDVCAAYDHLGSMLRYFPDDEIKSFFLNRWGETAIRSHKLLQDFLDARRLKAPQTYAGFSWFEDKAAALHRDIARSEAQIQDGKKWLS